MKNSSLPIAEAPQSVPEPDGQAPSDSPLIEGLLAALRQAGIRVGEHELCDGLPRPPAWADVVAGKGAARAWTVRALNQLGLAAEWRACPLDARQSDWVPSLLMLRDGPVVLCQYGAAHCRVVVPAAARSGAMSVSTATLGEGYLGQTLCFKPQPHADQRADDLVAVPGRHWFWHTVLQYKRYIGEAVALSVVINVLALAMSIFTMTVYNRVLPNQAYVTLWTLALGVGLAVTMECGARVARAWVLDRAGKKIDLVLGARIYRHVLATRLENRAQSSGAFANVVQSFETVRDLVTSATLTAVADLPFALLFLFVIYMVAGPLAWVVLGTIVVVITVALLVQIPLKRDAEESMKTGSIRHGLVVESLDNLETVKALRAESLLASRHDTESLKLAQLSMQSRFMSSWASTLLQSIQQLSTVVLLLWGAYLVGDGTISMGAIIATMTLSGRAMAPVGVLSALALRFQQARSSLQTLNRVMSAPQEQGGGQVYVQLPPAAGEGLRCEGVGFAYKPDLPPVVRGVDLVLARGERVAILGRMGSGKSTLLRLIVGLYQPTAGRITVDGIDSRQVDPRELRSRMALVTQEPRLMFGSLRDNLLMGAPHATDEEMVAAAEMTGVDHIVARHPKGYGMLVGERGDTLSGGQKQAISLARALLTRPEILLLDEPTSGMDSASERTVMNALEPVMAGRTVILVTHKPALLQFVERVIVMDEGVKVADGPKDEVLEALNAGRVPSAAAMRSAQGPAASVSASVSPKR